MYHAPSCRPAAAGGAECPRSSVRGYPSSIGRRGSRQLQRLFGQRLGRVAAQRSPGVEWGWAPFFNLAFERTGTLRICCGILNQVPNQLHAGREPQGTDDTDAGVSLALSSEMPHTAQPNCNPVADRFVSLLVRVPLSIRKLAHAFDVREYGARISIPSVENPLPAVLELSGVKPLWECNEVV